MDTHKHKRREQEQRDQKERKEEDADAKPKRRIEGRGVEKGTKVGSARLSDKSGTLRHLFPAQNVEEQEVQTPHTTRSSREREGRRQEGSGGRKEGGLRGALA